MIEVKEINSVIPEDGVAAYIDAKVRSNFAARDNPDFFLDPDHIAKVNEVKAIVDRFFRIKKNIYVNHRANRGNPFTTVKVDNPQFPNSLTQSAKNVTYYKPLEKLGVEIVFSKSTNSYLYHVK